MGNKEPSLDHVFANAAVRRFEVSHEQVVPKHKLLLVESDMGMFTATQMVMVRQVKLEAPDRNKLEKDSGKSWDGRAQHFVDQCDRHFLVRRGTYYPMLTRMPS